MIFKRQAGRQGTSGDTLIAEDPSGKTPRPLPKSCFVLFFEIYLDFIFFDLALDICSKNYSS